MFNVQEKMNQQIIDKNLDAALKSLKTINELKFLIETIEKLPKENDSKTMASIFLHILLNKVTTFPDNYFDAIKTLLVEFSADPFYKIEEMTIIRHHILGVHFEKQKNEGWDAQPILNLDRLLLLTIGKNSNTISKEQRKELTDISDRLYMFINSEFQNDRYQKRDFVMGPLNLSFTFNRITNVLRLFNLIGIGINENMWRLSPIKKGNHYRSHFQLRFDLLIESISETDKEKKQRQLNNLMPLLLARKFCEDSVFHEDYLPLDLFKYIWNWSKNENTYISSYFEINESYYDKVLEELANLVIKYEEEKERFFLGFFFRNIELSKENINAIRELKALLEKREAATPAQKFALCYVIFESKTIGIRNILSGGYNALQSFFEEKPLIAGSYVLEESGGDRILLLHSAFVVEKNYLLLHDSGNCETASEWIDEYSDSESEEMQDNNDNTSPEESSNCTIF